MLWWSAKVAQWCISGNSGNLAECLTIQLKEQNRFDPCMQALLDTAATTGESLPRSFTAGADLKGRADVIKGPGDLLAHSRRTREMRSSRQYQRGFQRVALAVKYSGTPRRAASSTAGGSATRNW